MKDEILNNLKMIDILDKYNIKHKRNQFCCPFHGIDKSPSAKAYEDSFYCFACNKTGDIIQFVQYLFNLSFKEAMQKINIDFGLGLDSNIKIDTKKINEIKRKREEKNIQYNNCCNQFKELCKKKEEYYSKMSELKDRINYLNWQDFVYEISLMQDKIGLIENQLDELLDKMYLIKR